MPKTSTPPPTTKINGRKLASDNDKLQQNNKFPWFWVQFQLWVCSKFLNNQHNLENFTQNSTLNQINIFQSLTILTSSFTENAINKWRNWMKRKQNLVAISIPKRNTDLIPCIPRRRTASSYNHRVRASPSVLHLFKEKIK